MAVLRTFARPIFIASVDASFRTLARTISIASVGASLRTLARTIIIASALAFVRTFARSICIASIHTAVRTSRRFALALSVTARRAVRWAFQRAVFNVALHLAVCRFIYAFAHTLAIAELRRIFVRARRHAKHLIFIVKRAFVVLLRAMVGIRGRTKLIAAVRKV